MRHGYADEAKEAVRPHGAAGYSVTNSTTTGAQQPLTVTHITAMMLSSAQTTPTGNWKAR